MAGFLDKNNRIIDMVLTGEGKLLLAKGDLRFVYFSLFDDEIDYDPLVSASGSMTLAALSASKIEQIEETCVREATTGYKRTNRSGSDNTNVFRPLFSVPQGQRILPRMRVIEGPTGSIDLTVKQQKIVDVHVQRDEAGNTIQSVGPFDRGYERTESQTLTFELGYAENNYPPDYEFGGFLIRIFQSGTEGYQEVGQKHDLQNVLSYNNDLKLFAGGAIGSVK